jgi:hypothetical protein
MTGRNTLVRAVVLALSVCIAAILSTSPGATADVNAASPTALRSITVFEVSHAIGNLAEPPPYSLLNVTVQSRESNLEIIAQIMPGEQERILVVSELDNQIITALSVQGVVGRSLPGGYEIRQAGEEAVLRLSGTIPAGSNEATIVTIISESPDGVQLLAQVRASVKSPPGLLLLASALIWPWGVVTALAALILVGIVLVRRHSGSAWDE